MTLPWWFFGLAVLVAWVLTGALRRYALARNVIDIPNARSSHKVPTPRGGGIAFVVTYIAGLCALLGTGALALDGVAVLAGGGAWIALIGFLDDHGHIQARWRLLAHFLAAAWVLYWMGGAPPLTLFGVALSTGWVLNAFAVLYLVWLLNLYNFMDGIDGLASIEAMWVAGGGVLLYALVGAPAAAIPSLLLVAAVAGFLIWNFPPAKIFMGDGGSGFLGLVLGALSLQAGWQSPALFWGWLILLGVFIVDATFTLLRRLLRGEKVYEAHRSHAYQFASRKWASHRRVTLAVLAINLLWLLPLAVAAVSGWLDGVVAVVIAYVPLFGLAILLKAGAGEPPSD